MRWNYRSTAAVQVPASPTRDDIQLVLKGSKGQALADLLRVIERAVCHPCPSAVWSSHSDDRIDC